MLARSARQVARRAPSLAPRAPACRRLGSNIFCVSSLARATQWRGISGESGSGENITVDSLHDFCEPDVPSFEGPEKTIDMWFSEAEGASVKSLRDIPPEVWQAKVCDPVRCQILSTIANSKATAFLLSESSMFVTDDKVYIKTCGTTTLLKAIPGIIEIAKSCGLTIVEDMFYGRQNFMFPNSQLQPHRGFDEEVAFLDQTFKGGAAFTIGRVNGSHYNIFNAEMARPRNEADSTLEVMMTGLDHTLMRQHFYKDTFDKGTLHASGIGGLFPNAVIDEYCFDPFGYSMNGIDGADMFNIHITPQPEQSYASFECNAVLADSTEMLHKVLAIFRPSKFMVVGTVNDKYLVDGLDPSLSAYVQEGVQGYRVCDKAAYHFQNYKLSYMHFQSHAVLEQERSEEVPRLTSEPVN